MVEFTKEEREWIKRHYKGVLSSELTEAFNREFGTQRTVSSIRAYKKNHKLSSGIDTKYKKGHVSINKGKHYEIPGGENYRYQKGNRPHNQVPVGTLIKTTTDNFVKRKVAEPNVWEFEHRLVWKQAHGEIPKGMVVIFLDGNRENCRLENLELISTGENQELNRKHLRSGNPEATKAAIAMIRLGRAIRERKNEPNNRRQNTTDIRRKHEQRESNRTAAERLQQSARDE